MLLNQRYISELSEDLFKNTYLDPFSRDFDFSMSQVGVPFILRKIFLVILMYIFIVKKC